MRREHGHAATADEAAWIEARSSERRAIRKHAILHHLDRTQTVLIRDMSAGGMKIQNAFGLVPGDTVRVELLTRRGFQGRVAWSVPPYCGIKFDIPLAEDDPLLATFALRVAQG